MIRYIQTGFFSTGRLGLSERLILYLFSELIELAGYEFSTSIGFIVSNINHQFIRDDFDNTDLNKKSEITLDVCDIFSL